MELRGGSFTAKFRILRTLMRALPHAPTLPARAAAPGDPHRWRAGARHEHRRARRRASRPGPRPPCLGVHNGFEGLIDGEIKEFTWMACHGWGCVGGAELGISRKSPPGASCTPSPAPSRRMGIDGLLMIGGWDGYEAAYKLYAEREHFPAFNIPIICLPATIDNNLPGSELSIGADTALNSIVEVVDKIKQSAVATRRCFVVEVMGRYCGYLALMSGLASGAERVYLPEEGVTLRDLQADLDEMIASFQQGKRLSLMIRNENANSLYTTAFMSSLFEEESHGLFDVRADDFGAHAAGRQPLALRARRRITSSARVGSNRRNTANSQVGTVTGYRARGWGLSKA